MLPRANRTRRSQFSHAISAVTEVLEQRQLLSATFDNSFGGDGTVIGPEGFTRSAAIAPDGSVVVLSDNQLLRFNPNGTRDNAFGGGDGVADLPIFGRTLEVQSDGKIVVGGAVGHLMAGNMALTRFNANGTVDSSFASSGTLTVHGGRSIEPVAGISDLEILADGRIVAAGHQPPRNNSYQGSHATVIRVTPGGALDTTFSHDGVTNISTGLEGSYAHALSIRPDGKAVVAINVSGNDGDQDVLVARVNADGFLDGSFGAQGTVRFEDLSAVYDVETQFGNKALLTDGKKIIRLNPNGTVDSTFNVIDAGANVSAPGPYLTELEVLPNQEILLLATRGNDITDGSTNVSFEQYLSNGAFKSTTRLPWGRDNTGVALEVQGDKAVAAGLGREFADAPSHVALSRLNLDGTGGGGTGTGLTGAYFDNDNFTNPKFTRVDPAVNFDWGAGSPSPSIAPDTFSVRWTGKITVPTSGTWAFYVPSDDRAKLTIGGITVVDYVPGKTSNAGTINLKTLAQYDIVLEYREFGGNARASLQWSGPGVSRQVVPTSALTPGTVTPPPPSSGPAFDNSFGGDGTVQGERGFVADAAMTPDGGVVVLVEQHKLYRFKANGDVDTSFGGGDGVIDTVPFARAVEVQADGKIVVGGSAGNVFSPGAAIGRYNADGTPDTSFSGDGILIIEGGRAVEAFSVIDDLEILGDGRIVASGSLVPPNNTTQSTQPTVFRITSSGELDRTFNRDGIATIPISAHAFGSATSLAVRPDGKLAVAGFINEDEAFATRVNTDGYFDGSFGTGGIVMLDSTRPPEDVEVQFGNKTLISDGIKIVRLNPNGTIDSTFKTIDKSGGITSPPPYLPDLEVRADNEIAVIEVLGNNIADGSTHTDFVRYSANGDRIGSLAIPWGSHTRAVALELQGNKAVLAGQGHQFSGEADRISIAKLILDGNSGA